MTTERIESNEECACIGHGRDPGPDRFQPTLCVCPGCPCGGDQLDPEWQARVLRRPPPGGAA
jgi:hypothetical protein